MNRLIQPIVDFRRRLQRQRAAREDAALLVKIQDVQEFETGGVTLPYDPAAISDRMKLSIARNRYEANEIRFLPEVIEPGEAVLELGTCLGLVATLCAKDERVSRVTTVEANPRLLPYAQRVFERNGVEDRIEALHGIALPGSSADEQTFYLSRHAWASTTGADYINWIAQVDVPVLDVNALIATRKPSLLMVDIEGGERELIEGLEPGSVKKLCLEFHPNLLGQDTVARLKQRLADLGFERSPNHSQGRVHWYFKT